MTAVVRTWVYYGTVLRVHDGDTIVVDLDLGLYLWRKAQSVRVAGINTPELPTPEGKAALAYAQSIVRPGQVLRLESVDGKFYEKYGRLLARVYYTDVAGVELDYGGRMIATGNAVPYLP